MSAARVRWAVWLAGAALLGGGCASQPGKAAAAPDPEISRASEAAQAAFARGVPEVAARRYAEALETARARDNAREIANAAYNQAACLIALGRYAAARALLEESAAEFRRSEGRVPGDVELLGAKAAVLLGDRALYRDALASLTNSPAVRESAGLRQQARLLEIRVACLETNAAAARLALDALAAGGRLKDPRLAAEAADLNGQTLRLEQKPRDSAQAFDSAARLYRQAQRPREMALALASAAAACHAAGQAGEAAERYYRSARSLWAQGDAAAGLRLLQPALEASAEAGDESMQKRIAVLFDDIRKSLPEAAAPTKKEEPSDE